MNKYLQIVAHNSVSCSVPGSNALWAVDYIFRSNFYFNFKWELRKTLFFFKPKATLSFSCKSYSDLRPSELRLPELWDKSEFQAVSEIKFPNLGFLWGVVCPTLE